MQHRRPERLAEQIREEVSLILGGEVEDPRIGFVTVTDAEVSPDLRYAKVFVSVLGDAAQIRESMSALNHAAGFIRVKLGAALRIKRTPELRFVHDDTVQSAARIEELLHEEVSKAKEREIKAEFE